MENIFVSAGLACVIAAIVGGGLKAFGIELPALGSVKRQALLGSFGMVLLFVGVIAPSSERKSPPGPESFRLEKVSGDEQIIPVGEYRDFTVRVLDSAGNPVSGAKVLWQTPIGGDHSYVSATDGNGVTSASNLYTFPNPGTYYETASLVARDSPIGFTTADAFPTIGPVATFRYFQR